jgi:replicative DNA helicase
MTKRLHEIVEERRLELIEWQKDPEKHKPVSTSIDALNGLIGGFPRYPFYLALIGLRKAGKSTAGFTLSLALAANTQKPTCGFMLEESKEEIADRAIAKASLKIGRTEIFQLRLTEEMFEEMFEIVELYKDVPFYINSSISNLDAILAEAKRLGVDQIVIDNFQLLTGGKGITKREQLEDLSQRLMRARQAGMTIFLVSQGNDEDNSAGSMQVQKDANITLALQVVHVDPTDKKSVVQESLRRILVKESRFSGQGGSADVFFDGNHSRILDLPEKMPDDDDFYKQQIATLDKYGDAQEAITEPAIQEPEIEKTTIGE